MADQVVVPVQSAISSRINQIAVAVFGLAIPIGTLTPILPEPYKGYSISAVAVLGAFGVWYYRTYGTASVTPSSVAANVSAAPLGDVLRQAGLSEPQVTNVLNAAQLKK